MFIFSETAYETMETAIATAVQAPQVILSSEYDKNTSDRGMTST